MDTRISSNGNVQIWALLASAVADPNAPTAAEVNAGLHVTDAIAWDSTTFPTGTESEDQDDRSLFDKGNATSRGASQYEAELNFFYPADLSDTTTDYGKAFQFFKTPGVDVILVVRVLQGTTSVYTPAAAGQWVSVYKFQTDSWTDDVEGDDSNKYAIGFLTQGVSVVYTQVKNATPVTVTNASGSASIAVGGHVVLRATLGGKRATQVVTWTSSDPGVASVSPNGVVTGQSTGSADIIASHPAASGPSTAVAITVA